MTISAPSEQGKPSELDERARSAWTTYRDSLRDLSGRDYDEAEGRSWDRLQDKLRQVEDERAALSSDKKQAAVEE